MILFLSLNLIINYLLIYDILMNNYFTTLLDIICKSREKLDFNLKVYKFLKQITVLRFK